MARPGRAPAGSPARKERAERILDATAELLRAHGYRRVSIEDVASRAGIGKGTIYLHWNTREALFWAVLQRETARLLDVMADRTEADPGLALPHRLMPALFLEVTDRPLVKAVLLADTEVLGALARDATVSAAQRELAGQPDYLELLAARGLLRDEFGVAEAGHVLDAVMRGFFAEPDTEAAATVSVKRRAELLGLVFAHTLEPDRRADAKAVQSLSVAVSRLFRRISATQRGQLERAY